MSVKNNIFNDLKQRISHKLEWIKWCSSGFEIVEKTGKAFELSPSSWLEYVFSVTASGSQDFSSKEYKSLALCNNVFGVTDVLDHIHETSEWRVFTDFSQTNLKSVL